MSGQRSRQNSSNRVHLYTVGGTTNALTYQTDGLGDVTIIGRGAGGVETGHGILTDLISIHRYLR